MERKSTNYAKYAELFTLAETDARVRQPYALAKVNGHNRLSLLDSGSGINAVCEAVANTADSYTETFDCAQHVEGANGVIHVTKKVKLPVKMGNRTYEVMFAVIPDLPIEVLFGTTFMSNARVVLNMAENSYSIAGEVFPFLNKNGFEEQQQRDQASLQLSLCHLDEVLFDLQTDFPEMENKLRGLMDEFRDLFGTEARIAHGIDPVRIETGDAKPIAQKVKMERCVPVSIIEQ